MLELPAKQANRLYARYFLHLTATEIAKTGGGEAQYSRTVAQKSVKKPEKIIVKASFFG